MRYLTKEWYLACQTRPMTAEIQAQLDETSHAFRAARACEDLPPDLLRDFSFHDGVVRDIRAGDIRHRLSVFQLSHGHFPSCARKAGAAADRCGLALRGALPP